MGIFSSLLNAWSEAYENGKVNTEKINHWKKAEAEYRNGENKSSVTLETIIGAISKGIEIGKIESKKRELDLKIKYGKNTEEALNALKKERNELRKSKITETKDYEVQEEDFIERYNAYRDKRAAICISYLSNSKATERGKKDALKILLKSPYCRNMEEIYQDCNNLKQRIIIYKRALDAESKLSALDFCFYNNILIKAEIILCNKERLDETWYTEMLSYVMIRQNTLKYNDEMYHTHFQQMSFYNLSIDYNEKISRKEQMIFAELYKYVNKEKNNFRKLYVNETCGKCGICCEQYAEYFSEQADWC